MKTETRWRRVTRNGVTVVVLLATTMVVTTMGASPASARTRPRDDYGYGSNSDYYDYGYSSNSDYNDYGYDSSSSSYDYSYQAARRGANGCTASPDYGYFPTTFNFHDACNAHDTCYDLGYYGGPKVSRGDCDYQFYNNLTSSCDELHGRGRDRSTCYNLSGLYYVTVSILGEPFYNNPYLN